MQFAFSLGRRQNRRSRAAQKAVSPKRVRRRRQAQKRQRFSAALRSMQTLIRKSGGLWPGFEWRQLRRASLLPGFSGLVPSKTLSLLLLAAVVAALYWMQSSESFFVYHEDVRFEGAKYLTNEELFAACGVNSWSILWLEPEKIQAQVTRHPYVADADVQLRWPAQIDISIREVLPVALWATDQQEYWLLEDGSALAPKELDAQPSLRIIDPTAAARTVRLSGDLKIDARILTSAIFLSDRLSIVNEFWYNSRYGLNFNLPSTQAWVYWGDGGKFDEKWAALQSSMPALKAGRGQALTLNVKAPNRPFIRRYDAAPAEK